MAHNDAAERFLGSPVWAAGSRAPEVRPALETGPSREPGAAGLGSDPEQSGLPAVHLRRERLLEHLDAAVDHPVTLVCAPTGWGKTVLAASWIRAGRAPGRTAYVRFEPNCGAAAWRQLAAALHTAGIALDPATYAWTGARLPERAAVVLDDLHNVTNRTVLRRIERLMTRLGDRIGFLLLARSEPPLSLYRWRVRGQLTELRADHLAFTQAEIDGLAERFEVRLPRHFRHSLWHVTEGWPAAAAVALSAMVGRHEPERIVTDLVAGEAGLTEQVGLTEYMQREILAHLDPDVYDVMLRTSIVETVCPGLVEAITGSRTATRQLAQASRANALATFYGGSHSWYRYRRLLRSVLRAEVRTTLAAEEHGLHRAAAGWYAANGLPGDALVHAALGADWVSAERLFLQYWPELCGSGPRGMALRTGPQPPEDIAERPILAFALAICCRDVGDPAGMSAFIRLGARAPAEAEAPLQAAILAGMRLAEAVAAEDPDRGAEAATRLLHRIDEAAGEHLYADAADAARAAAHLALTSAAIASDALDRADAALELGAALARKSGFNLLIIQANRQQGMVHLQRGRLSAAAACARRVLDGSRDAGITESRTISHARLLLVEVCRLRGQLDEARFHLCESITAEVPPDPHGWVSGILSLAVLLFEAGDCSGSAETLDPLLGNRLGSLPPLTEVTARVLHADLCLAEGRAEKALTILDELDRHCPGHPAVALARARIALAEDRPEMAAGALRSLLTTPSSSLVAGVAAGVLLAQALYRLGDTTGATEQIELALRLAASEGVRLPFLGNGPWIARLLEAPRPPAPIVRVEPEPAEPVQHMFAVAAEQMADPLTERETLVLQYLRSMLSIAEIAAVLSVSANTVKTHVRHVYRKLGVSRRRDAVRRGRELSLI
ncbi:LuxR C-terminal-related transcriptional regulator [Dactylosporangium vinaceum]|uniref:LuxR C-terminal-related transcriptional regulator n=1 Tax=Dactylosporangium vinaceum TaxID=53362 RepID=UPI001CA855B8|nr:LuxR C-terminal-related transcriptional regulator [Dactylosporangium vinaceum]